MKNKLKILALGGSGDMGRMTVAILLEFPVISSITVADKSFERANHFVELVGSEKLTAAEIDVTEHDKLVQLISEHDLVVNTVGPYYKFAVPIIEAAIEAKKNYIDINDDAYPTLDTLKRSEKAKQAGITAIVGFGASPGITNLMAVLACFELDEIEEVITAWGFGTMEEGEKPKYHVLPSKFYAKYKDAPFVATAAFLHLFYEALEKIPTFMDGKMVEIEPLTEATPLQIPGFKDAYVCHIGHPEPVTLPRVINANSVSNLMYLGKTATNMFRKYKQKIQEKELSINESTVAFLTELRIQTKRNPIIMKEYAELPPYLSVVVTGKKDGKSKKIAIAVKRAPFGAMAGVTAVPLGIGAKMLLEGEIKEKGVFTPEEIFKNKEKIEQYFDKYAKYCGENFNHEDVLLKEILDL